MMMLGQLVKSTTYNVHTCIYMTCSVSCNVYTWYIRVRTLYIHVHMLYMGSTYGIHIPLWYVSLCFHMNCSCVLFVQFINNAMVQDSAFLYRQYSYRDMHAKKGYARNVAFL